MSEVGRAGESGGAADRLATASPHHDHVVTFYDDDASLVTSVVHFLRPAIESGEQVIVVATPEHHDAVVEALIVGGAGARDHVARHVLSLDAAETLTSICDDSGALSSRRFREVVGGAIERSLGDQSGVRIFGEMVSLLWHGGDVAGAIGLEDLWNDLLHDRSFGLLCAYPSSLFDDPSVTEAFRTMCGQHEDVLPDASFDDLSESEQRRAVALLQQESRAFRSSEQALLDRLEQMDDDLEDAARRDDDRRALLAMIAHDLGSPTGVLRGVLDILRTDWKQMDRTGVDELLDAATANAARIGRLATDVLTLGRIEGGKFSLTLREVDLIALVEQVVSEVRRTSRRTVELTVGSGVRPVLADPDRQAQVLHNLLSNAVKYSPEDSAIHVAVAMTPEDEHVGVCVRDHGEGIAPEDLGSLFQPFSRLGGTTDGPAGTGLGLFIAKALVEAQGGTITVETGEGRGSSFCYSVPVAVTA